MSSRKAGNRSSKSAHALAFQVTAEQLKLGNTDVLCTALRRFKKYAQGNSFLVRRMITMQDRTSSFLQAPVAVTIYYADLACTTAVRDEEIAMESCCQCCDQLLAHHTHACPRSRCRTTTTVSGVCGRLWLLFLCIATGTSKLLLQPYRAWRQPS